MAWTINNYHPILMELIYWKFRFFSIVLLKKLMNAPLKTKVIIVPIPIPSMMPVSSPKTIPIVRAIAYVRYVP